MNAPHSHRAAMDLAEQAHEARRRGELVLAEELLLQALKHEANAARDTPHDLEPTRAVLFRSAATLALQAREFRTAEQLVGEGLAGSPPDDIADELRDLFEQLTFERHLKARGVELQPNEFELSLSGNAIGHGISDSNEFSSRVEVVHRLLLRTGERLLQRPYRDRGRTKDSLAQELQLFLAVPKAASFSVGIRIGAPEQLTLPGIEQQSVVSRIMADVFDCLQIYDSGNLEALHGRIPDDAYYRNFAALARSFAPDGDNVKQVALEMYAPDTPRQLFLRHPRAPSPATEAIETSAKATGHGLATVQGILKFADSTTARNVIRLVDDDGVSHRIVVPEGLMNDIVKPMWNTRVVVTGHRSKEVVVLQDIMPAEE